MTRVKLYRPEEPDLAKLWDEAREAVAQRCTCGKRDICACGSPLPAPDPQWAETWSDEE